MAMYAEYREHHHASLLIIKEAENFQDFNGVKNCRTI